MQDLVLAESKAALAREAAARRKLHNLVQELRGNIRVFVRVKPADARAKGAPVLACEDGQRIACTAAGTTKARCLFRTPCLLWLLTTCSSCRSPSPCLYDRSSNDRRCPVRVLMHAWHRLICISCSLVLEYLLKLSKLSIWQHAWVHLQSALQGSP